MLTCIFPNTGSGGRRIALRQASPPRQHLLSSATTDVTASSDESSSEGGSSDNEHTVAKSQRGEPIHRTSLIERVSAWRKMLPPITTARKTCWPQTTPISKSPAGLWRMSPHCSLSFRRSTHAIVLLPCALMRWRRKFGSSGSSFHCRSRRRRHGRSRRSNRQAFSPTRLHQAFRPGAKRGDGLEQRQHRPSALASSDKVAGSNPFAPCEADPPTGRGSRRCIVGHQSDTARCSLGQPIRQWTCGRRHRSSPRTGQGGRTGRVARAAARACSAAGP